MAQRLNTIIIVPHSKAKFLKFSFSTRTLMAVVTLVSVAALLSVLAIAYTGTTVARRAEVLRLRGENRELAQVNRDLEKTLGEVQGRLDEFEEKTARLALMAGMETDTIDIGERRNRSEGAGSGGLYSRLPESPEQLALQGKWVADQLGRVEDKLLKNTDMLASTPTIAPVPALITAGFGRRIDPFTGRPAFHSGLDLSARRGTSVIATADGIVVSAGHDGGLGRTVAISHGFGYTTLFGHLDKVMVEPGEEVQRGQVIGLLGSTGRSTGPHLHYEVHVDGSPVNPLEYILNAF